MVYNILQGKISGHRTVSMSQTGLHTNQRLGGTTARNSTETVKSPTQESITATLSRYLIWHCVFPFGNGYAFSGSGTANYHAKSLTPHRLDRLLTPDFLLPVQMLSVRVFSGEIFDRSNIHLFTGFHHSRLHGGVR